MVQLFLDKRAYKAFIDYATTTCDCFSLVFEKTNGKQYVCQDVFMCIEECTISKSGVGIHPETHTHFSNSDMVCFVCNKQSRSVLMEAENLSYWDGNQNPAELCFYRDQKIWFYTVSHEKTAFLVSPDERDMYFLNHRLTGCWEMR
jgi:hypothetical protein